jgi:hypothetical protein
LRAVASALPNVTTKYSHRAANQQRRVIDRSENRVQIDEKQEIAFRIWAQVNKYNLPLQVLFKKIIAFTTIRVKYLRLRMVILSI